MKGRTAELISLRLTRIQDSQPGFRNPHPASLAAELQVVQAELFFDLVQAGHAEVLTFQQVITGAADQFADGADAESDHAFTSPHGKVQIGDRTFINRDVFIGDGAVIGSDCEIGKGATILAGAVVPDGTVIGKNQTVSP